MYLDEFFFHLPLFAIARPRFPIVDGYLPVFTEELHAERLRDGNQIKAINDISELEDLARRFANKTVGVCFDPVSYGNLWVSKAAFKWELLHVAIHSARLTLERSPTEPFGLR